MLPTSQPDLPWVIFVDANVFYSRTLRDWLALMYLAEPPVIQVCWSEDVLSEAIYHLRRDHPEWDGGRITRVRDLIAGTFSSGRVENYPHDLLWGGGDPHDAHVHAAASACSANYLLTCDSGFAKLTQDELDQLPYEVYCPDELFVLLDDKYPGVVRQACQKQVDYWVKKQGEVNLCESLKLAGCPEFAERVRAHLFALQSRSELVNWDC